jgi:urate oxidase
MSIQHLLHEMGQRMLARFPQLAEVVFDGQNRLWDTVVVSKEDAKIKSYCDPRPPYGSIHLTLQRS